MTTFIVDCIECKAKVAAEEFGIAERYTFDNDQPEPFGQKLLVGKCPRCRSLIAGMSYQTAFEGYDSDEDQWSEVERVYPQPTKTFSSYRIPSQVTKSLEEGNRCIQAGAFIAACAMFGRALEAVCQDALVSSEIKNSKQITLALGISKLLELKLIDQKLYDWSQQLRAFRNIAAHAVDLQISREDADDLKAFVYAIIEYIYDLTDR
jgi:hypothetical protein